MMTAVEPGVSAPTLALPRKRERGPTDIGARESITLGRPNLVGAFSFEQCRVVSNELSIRQSPPPLPLAGEGWGAGLSTAGAAS